MVHANRILLVSRDVRLLQTRKLMLGAYFEVCPAARAAEATLLLQEYSFQLIVLCYSLTEEDCRKILAAAKARNAGARLLTITLNGRLSADNANGEQISMDEGPLALLKQSAELLGFEFRTKGRLIHALQPRKRTESPGQQCA